MRECWVTVTLTSGLISIFRIEVGTYLIFFEVGIPNLVCECVLGWLSVMYHLWVTVTLTSDLVFRIIVSRAYLILFEVGIPNLVCGCILG